MAGKLIARLGDPGSHGGEVVSSFAAVWCEGIQAAGVGDVYACRIHGPNPIISGSPDATFEGRRCAHDGSRTACGATINATAASSFVSGG